MNDLDMPALGRKISRISPDGLVAILSGVRRDQWPLMARAYLLAIGIQNIDQSIPSVLNVWGQLVKEHGHDRGE